MKKSFIMMVLMATSLVTACDDDDEKAIDFSALPQTAQTFVSTYFNDKKVAAVYHDKERFGSEYEVIFSDGANIDFRSDGDWGEVEDRDTDGVPTAIIPAPIYTYVTTNHSNQHVVQIGKENAGYEVELNSGLDLEFDTKGVFIRYDD